MELTQISKNCNNCREGTPKCLLGQIQDERLKPKTIQVQGRPAIDILNKFKSNSFKDQYKIFIIGTNPDRESDKKDIPFLGAAGDFLTEFITKSGMPVDDVWCTYLVKCASPKGRNPSAGELNTCMSYIQEEIKRYKPEIIMLLGNIPLKLFNIREGGISKCRGKVFKKKLPDWEDGPEFSVIPSYNPATFVYRDNKKLRDLVIEDYCIAASLATGKEHKASFYQCNFTVAKTVEDVFTACEVMESEGIFGVDTESPNLNFMRAPMMLLQLSAGVNKTHLIPFYSYDPSSLGEWKLKSYWSNDDRNRVRDRLNKLFSHPKWKAVFHNAKYDLNIIKRWLSVDVKNEVHDTQVMHHLIYEYPPHDLKSLADMEFHVGDWEAPVREVVGGEEGDSNLSWDNCPDEILWPYGANDAELTRRLFDTYWETISSKPHLLKLYYEESIPITSTLQKAEWNGNKIDLKKVDEMEKLYLERMELSLIECRKLAGKPDFNPSSPDQVAEVLRGRATPENGILNLITDLTKSKGFSTGKDILIELDDPFAEKVLEYRKYRKLISTYIDRVREDIDETNRVRYQFRVAGTASGRLSCRFLQQIPRIDKESIKKEEVILRQMFIEDDGYDLVYFDVDQAELWVFAYKSQCKEMIRILESGEDIHRHTAAAALQVSLEETSDFNRSNLGKPFNFGVIYGSQGFQIAKCEFQNPKTGKLEKVGRDRAMLFASNFMKKYPEIEIYKADLVDISLANNCVYRTEFGREIHVPELTSNDDRRVNTLTRELLNKSVQGPAGSITLRTLNMIDAVLAKYNIDTNQIRLINTVHDSGLYGVKKHLTEWFKGIIKSVAERPIPEIYSKKFTVKIGVGSNWAEAELNAK